MQFLVQHFTNKLILFVFYIHFIHTKTHLCIILMNIHAPQRQLNPKISMELLHKIWQTYPGAMNAGVP